MESSDRDAIRAVLDTLVEKMQGRTLSCEDCPCFLPLDVLGEPGLAGRGLCVQLGFDDAFVAEVADGPCEAFEREVVSAMHERGFADVGR